MADRMKISISLMKPDKSLFLTPPPNVNVPTYDRTSLLLGLVHLGVGGCLGFKK